MSQFKTKQFKKLQDEYYQKLKEDGFNDIEDAWNDKLKEYNSRAASRKLEQSPFASKIYEETLEYFRLCDQILETYHFKSIWDRCVWSLHAKGFTNREIEKYLRLDGLRKSTINNIIKEIRSFMLNDENKPITRESLIAHRAFKPEDLNFILSTWIKGYFYGSDELSYMTESPMAKREFFIQYEPLIKSILSRPTTKIKVACLSDSFDDIVGYSVEENQGNEKVLHWVFVRSEWRKIGIAKSLLNDKITHVSHLSNLGKKLNKYNWIYNPFLTKQPKGSTNGSGKN